MQGVSSKMNRKHYSFTIALDLMVGFLTTNSPVGGLFVLAEANDQINKQIMISY